MLKRFPESCLNHMTRGFCTEVTNWLRPVIQEHQDSSIRLAGTEATKDEVVKFQSAAAKFLRSLPYIFRLGQGRVPRFGHVA